MKILLTGATGFVGRHLYPALIAGGHSVVSASRDPDRAAADFPGRVWRYLDVDDTASIRNALRGCEAAFYLVHGMSGGPDYPEREEQAAGVFSRATEDAQLARVVYLGGMAPQGKPSRHLSSRLKTGAILRASRVPTIELRASMIVGHGSASWRICRDLAVRLPLMVLPRWLRSRTQPIAIADVVFALAHAVGLDASHAGAYDIPGPDTLSVREILERIARLDGTRPMMISVPFLTPHLSAYWIRLVARADPHLASELVEGLRSDILARDDRIFGILPKHICLSFDDAARLALDAEHASTSRLARTVERGIHRAARKI